MLIPVQMLTGNSSNVLAKIFNTIGNLGSLWEGSMRLYVLEYLWVPPDIVLGTEKVWRKVRENRCLEEC